jgi:hypothetical protein
MLDGFLSVAFKKSDSLLLCFFVTMKYLLPVGIESERCAQS